MSVINILSPHLADMIAAGEVVERPASVIKELMENSFDAGAESVTAEIRGGGALYIRITDNGCGMGPDDAGLAFTRHATSKLKGERDLEAIGTMGFRGEALAAISAVSRVELTTRLKGADEGIRVTLTAGEIDDMVPVGCPEGTTIVIRDLFYNTPARQKFMKSDRSEASACLAAAVRCALARPEVSVRFIRDGEELFFSPGDSKVDSCIYSVLGRDYAKDMLKCESDRDGLKLTGFVSSPAACRGNRTSQFFFCNGRFIRSAVMQSALEQAYKNSMLIGKYPACVLYLSIPLGNVDVNVHPAKTEVKFSEEKKVFDLVYYGVLSSLDKEKHPETSTTVLSKADPDFYKSMSSEAFRRNGYSATAPAADAGTGSASRSPSPVVSAPLASVEKQYGETSRQMKLDLPSSVRTSSVFTASAVHSAPVAPSPSKSTTTAPKAEKAPEIKTFSTPEPVSESVIVENSVQNVENSSVPDHKISGELFKKYIIVEQNDDVVLIDKHAAHERMIFDRLKASASDITAQMLLIPAPLRLNDEDCELLENNGELLERLGFEIEALDRGNFVVRAVPADMYAEDVVPAIEEILDKLRSGRAPDPESARDEVLHTVACKAAIKAGWDTSVKELERVTCAVLSGEVLYCPHGRPVSFRISGRELDKRFKRIV